MINNRYIRLNQRIDACYEESRLQDQDRQEIVEAVNSIQKTLNKNIPNAHLTIVGSLATGFATKNSDVDLCFTFSDKEEEPLENIKLKTLQDISEVLDRNNLPNRFLSTAEVPIVRGKADFYRHGLEIDIAYYNTLASYNTKLLAKYCEWEPERLPKLGIWVKKWAKENSIIAHRRYPSSYAWMIMVIFYLQRCNPPVLPFLQDSLLFEEIHLGCNIWFEKDVQKSWSENTSSVADLFTDFLQYFESFDRDTQVIQIRTKHILLKTEKKWNSLLCIEDPFDLDHNLTNRVDETMVGRILEATDKARHDKLNDSNSIKHNNRNTPE